MHCIVLVGGIIGVGKTTLIRFIRDHKKYLFESCFSRENENLSEVSNGIIPTKLPSIFTIKVDDLCSLKEQGEMMQTIKGWKQFRKDLLLAAEHFITSICKLNYKLDELSSRSLAYFDKLNVLNEYEKGSSCSVFLIEDNFYYRSMRYDWFQIAKRAHMGFCQVFLQCPLELAVERNLSRSYKIPASRIELMMSKMEYPNSQKAFWEKYSIILETSSNLEIHSLNNIIHTILNASNHPAESVVKENVALSQKICLTSAIHQADIILRRLTSRKINEMKEVLGKEELATMVSNILEIRSELLKKIREGFIEIPMELLKQLKESGIQSVRHEYEEFLKTHFDKTWDENVSDISCKLSLLQLVNKESR